MALGSEMDDAIHLVVLHQFQHQVEITDITLYESIVRLVLDVLEVSQVTSVSQLVEIDDVILRIFVHEKSNYVRADETSTARYYNILHSNQCIYSNTNYTNHSGETITSIFVLFVRFVFKKINILNSSLKFDLSLQELKGDTCHSLYLQLLILQELLVYCCNFQLATGRRLETSFWLKGGRGFQKCIPSNHPITNQRYEKGNRHTARSIRYIPHDYRSNRSTHYRHDKQ